MKKISFLFLIIIMCSCLPDEPTFNSFRRSEVQRLLSDGERKRWSLEERVLFNETVQFDSCEISRQLIFNFTADTRDRDSLFYINPADTCGLDSDTLKGFWFVPRTLTAETQIDTVVFVWESIDTAYFNLFELNPSEFSISTYFEEDSLRESYTVFPFEEPEEEPEEAEEPEE